MGHQVEFGTAGLAPTSHFRLPTCILPLPAYDGAAAHPLPNTSLHDKKKEENTGFLRIINVQIPFQVKLTLVVNSPAYMNITKAPWIILSDILISATVSTRYLPPSCGSGVWRFSRVAILGVCVLLCVYVCVCVQLLYDQTGLLEVVCMSGGSLRINLDSVCVHECTVCK